jgi:hypothetical protein
MPQHQKPQDRAKEKRRLTRRLAKWRATQAAQDTTPAAPAPTKAKKPVAA